MSCGGCCWCASRMTSSRDPASVAILVRVAAGTPKSRRDRRAFRVGVAPDMDELGDRSTATDGRRRATIHDVARESGVALSTVSNALSGKGYVREETRRAVRDAADRLGYRASAVARALRTQRTCALGVLMADVANPSSPDFVRGIEDVALREGSTLLLCNTDGSEEKQLSQMRSLLDRRVDGMVLLSQHCASAPVRALLDTGIPFVLVQRRSAEYRDNYVGADNETSIVAAVDHLVSLGHRRIAFVRGPANSSAVAERLAAFLGALAASGIRPRPELVYDADYGTDAGYAAASALLSSRQPPTAILASNDMNALGVLDAAAERGIDVPGQLSVVGYDDIALARLARIDLTTIRLPKREMGAAAAELLMEQVHSETTLKSRSVVFPTRLVIRGTTGPLAG